MIDCVNSFFKYVKSRIIVKNPQRTVVSIVEANAWPPKNIKFNAFYLLLMGEAANGGTPSGLGISHSTQWMWVIPGDDISQDKVGNNRGNRYAINYQMKEELIYGLFPYFCEKNTYIPQQQGNTLVAVPTALNERIWWSRPRFMPTKFEKQEGIIYGAVQVAISEFEAAITS